MHGRVRRRAATAGALPLLVGLVLPSTAEAAPASLPGQVSQETSAGTTSASAQAAASGEPVEVVGERTAYSTTMANPDGTYTLTQSVTPQRVKAADGSWRGVDVTLERRPDGTIGPKAAVVDLAFSGGGDEQLVRLGVATSSMTLDWPGTLPAPTLDGATATYPEVLAGVDLKMTATAEGYREVLVVKSAEAAANPELEQVKLAVSSERLEIAPGAGGGLQALDEHGNPVFKGPAGQMWDSAGDEPASGPQPQLLRTADASEPEPIDGGVPGEDLAHPGEGDNSAILPVQVADGAVTVEPDLSLLRGPETVYPVYIDPPVGLGVSERTVISSDGDRFWDFDGDYGVGKCGSADGYYCGNGYVNRMLFEFSPTRLTGKYVLDATFRAYETWSFNCTAYWVDLERTDNISESTRWPGPKQLDQMGDRLVSAGRGTHCDPDQPDAWIEFNDNPAEGDENLASTVRAFADGKMSRLTFMLRAKDESEPRAWKRFDDNAELKVTYAHKPGVPTDVGLIPGDGTTILCNKTESSPLVVTRTDPRVLARVQTLVQPKADEETGSLQAEFEIERKDTSGWVKAMSDYRPRPGWDTDGTLEGMRTPALTDGKLYRYKARTQSHWSYDGKAGDLFSPYAGWCYFVLDTTAPKAPRISSDGPYELCADICVGQGGPGTPGKFTFLPNTVDAPAEITGYRYWLGSWTAAQTKVVTVGTPQTGQVQGEFNAADVTPQLGGHHTLYVQARDVRQRWGDTAAFPFKVKDGTPESGRWRFNDALPGSTVRVAKDTGIEGTVRHDATLYTDGAGWSSQGRRGDTDQGLWLDSANPNLQTGYAATSGPAVNTSSSFTVATWVHMTNAPSNAVVLSQPGSKSSAFALYYSTYYKAWVFNRADKDQDAPALVRSISGQQSPPLRVWTHLAGVFDTQGDADKTNDTLQLFVNGRPQQKVVIATMASTYEPWTATGGLQFGRAVRAGSGIEHFHGLLDETAVWQRPLKDFEIAQEAKLPENGVPTNDLVGSWTAAGATNGIVSETSPYYKQGLQMSGSGAKLDESQDALVLDGVAGYAGTTGPMVDETGSFTVSARVQLDTLEIKPVGYEAQVAGQRIGGESSWALWAVKVAEGAYQWKFTRTALNAAGTVEERAEIAEMGPAVMGEWVDVTGVFDAQAWGDENRVISPEFSAYGQLHLYVGSAPVATSSFAAVQQGSGEMAVGRGNKAGTTGHYLPGALQTLRIWTGAMTADQISSQVLESQALSTL